MTQQLGQAVHGRGSRQARQAELQPHCAYQLAAPLPPPSSGSLGMAHVHPLAALVRTGQAKHGSVEGMAAAERQKTAKKERAAASKQEAAAARRAALGEAAGVQVT